MSIDDSVENQLERTDHLFPSVNDTEYRSIRVEAHLFVMTAKPIPAFYCAYLLRSIPKPNSTPYVGSTPHILRRWKQHNGLVGGGAFRTARLAGSLRPWEVACIVYGFPSQVAALQFEWAWQHAHLSRHVTPADRLANPQLDSNGRRAGKRATLSTKIADLHTLLHSKSFARWPLSLRFFSADAYQAWRLWDDRSVNTLSRRTIPIDLDIDETKKRRKLQGNGKLSEETTIDIPPALERVDVNYSSMGAVLNKTTTLFETEKNCRCSVCRSSIKAQKHSIIICPHEDCSATSHLTCLAGHTSDLGQNHNRQIVPIDIKCPTCKRITPWIDLVKEMTLRTNGPSLAQKTLKQWKKKQLKAMEVAPAITEEPDPDDEEAATQNDQDDSWFFQEFDDQLDAPMYNVVDNEFQDIDIEPERLSDIDNLPTSAQVQASARELPIVIPDSDWDNVEVLD
jgi:structure-specific endonuclease subunit SLX1